jgi:hypothetical protein
MLLLLSRCIANLLRLLLLLLQTLIKLILLLTVSGGSGKTLVARDRQELIVVFVGEVECEDRRAIARLRIALSLGFPLRIQQVAKGTPEVLPDKGHEVRVILSYFILIKVLVLTHHRVF